MADTILAKILSKKDKIAALPPEMRSAVIDRLFARAVDIPKNFTEEQRSLVRKNFEATIVGGPPTKIDLKPTPKDYQGAGINTGMFGRGEAGLTQGLANLAKLLDKGTGMEPGAPAVQEIADLQKAATQPYAERHPIKAGAAELVGQGVPSLPLEMAIPGSGLASSVAKGAVSMMPYDPTLKGAMLGAGGGALFHGVGAGINKVLKNRGVAKVATASADQGPSARLAALAQEKFGKPLADLSPQEKMEAVDAWKKEASDKTAEAAKASVEARKAAKATAEAERVKEASAKIDQKIATRRAMDEAKALQKRITWFVKHNKRAPNEEELTKLRSADPGMFPEEAAHVAKVKPNEAPPTQPTANPEIPKADAFKAENPEAVKAVAAVSEVAKQVAKPFSPENIFEGPSVEGYKHLEKLVKIPSGQSGLTEGEQALMAKIDDAVTRIAESKDPKVVAALQKTIDNAKLGLQGNKEAMRRISEAERKATERAKAAPMPEVQAHNLNPEEHLQKLETEYLEMTDKLEAFGKKGKEAAKNINMLVKGKKLTMQQALEMFPKIEGVLSGKSNPN